MKENDNYCGFVCGDIIEEQQAIIDKIIEFSKVNREYALVMIGKIMDMVYYSKDKLSNGLDPEVFEDSYRTAVRTF